MMRTVVGHKIAAAGAPFPSGDCAEPVCLVSRPGSRVPADRGGHALCECGATGLHVWSKRERQQWHRMHKTQVSVMATRPERLAMAGADG